MVFRFCLEFSVVKEFSGCFCCIVWAFNVDPSWFFLARKKRLLQWQVLHFPSHKFFCNGRKEKQNLGCVFSSKFCQISIVDTFYLISWCLEKAAICPARFIQVFNVTYQVNCVLLRRKGTLKKLRQFQIFDVICELYYVLH